MISVEEREKICKDIKVVCFFVMFVFVFVIIWVFYIIVIIIIFFCDSCIDIYFYEFLVWLLWVKLVINFFLYVLNSVLFYKNFRKFLRCCKKFNNVNYILIVVFYVVL